MGMSASLLSDTLHAATVNAKSSYHHDHSADEKFWDKISKEFILDKNTVYMNTGTTGSMPKSVLKSYNSNNSIVASNPWDMQHKFGSWPYVTEMATLRPVLGLMLMKLYCAVIPPMACALYSMVCTLKRGM